MTDYSNSVIYEIICLDPKIKDSYMGSSCDVYRRSLQHARNCCDPLKRDYNAKRYQFIRENGGWSNWTVVPLEIYPCSTKDELLQREMHYIKKYQPTLNVTYCHGSNFLEK